MKVAKVKDKPIYQCPVSGFHYKTLDMAKQFETFCRTYASCSMDIAAKSIERKSKKD